MILMALTAAATVAAASPPIPKTERMPNLYSVPARCGPLHDEITRRIRTASGPALKPMYAVNRTVDGCPVPTPAGYHPDYLLPGAADPQAKKAPPR
jgi:hypothetical protein